MENMVNVKAVVFDFGKVICFPPDDGVLDTLAALAGLRREVFEPLLWKYREEYDRGVLDGEEYYRRFLAAAGVRLEGELLRRMHRLDLESWKHINPETVRLMEDVKKAGFKLGILSNMPHDYLAFARANFPVFSLPDVGIFSCEVGSIKPETRIYEALIAALDCEAAETVFFDDMEPNILKAAELGFRSFLWKDVETAREELRALGIELF